MNGLKAVIAIEKTIGGTIRAPKALNGNGGGSGNTPDTDKGNIIKASPGFRAYVAEVTVFKGETEESI